MEKTKTLRPLMVYGLLISVFWLPGCSIIEKKTAAGTPTETVETAYYTCGGCHGPKNVRVDFMSPKIIGQKKVYLAAKLRDFRDMKRINPYMNGVVAGLTDQDIDNLAAYYSNYGQGKK
jgi:cytochrome c553